MLVDLTFGETVKVVASRMEARIKALISAKTCTPAQRRKLKKMAAQLKREVYVPNLPPSLERVVGR